MERFGGFAQLDQHFRVQTPNVFLCPPSHLPPRGLAPRPALPALPDTAPRLGPSRSPGPRSPRVGGCEHMVSSGAVFPQMPGGWCRVSGGKEELVLSVVTSIWVLSPGSLWFLRLMSGVSWRNSSLRKQRGLADEDQPVCRSLCCLLVGSVHITDS